MDSEPPTNRSGPCAEEHEGETQRMKLSYARFSKYEEEHERETQCMKLSDATFSSVNLLPIALGHVKGNMSMRHSA